MARLVVGHMPLVVARMSPAFVDGARHSSSVLLTYFGRDGGQTNLDDGFGRIPSVFFCLVFSNASVESSAQHGEATNAM